MNDYNPLDWYWLREDGRVYSSGKNRYLFDPVTDEAYRHFLLTAYPTPFPRDVNGEESEAELAALLAPFGVIPVFNLETAKAVRIDAIDEKTASLIKHGFEYTNKRFSMSDAAQRNWTALAAGLANDMLAFPMTISTIDEATHTIENATQAKAFLGAYLMYQANPNGPLGSGRILKEMIRATKSIEEIECIIDDRQ